MRASLKAVLSAAAIGLSILCCAVILTGCESAYYGGLPSATPQTGYGITGYISQSPGLAGTGVTMTLVDRATGETLARTQSDNMGKYIFYPLRPGNYRVTAETVAVDVAVVNGHVRQDISLAGSSGESGWSASLPRDTTGGTSGSQGNRSPTDPGGMTHGADPGTDPQLRNLLLSSSWCSFSYKSGGSTGYSSTSNRRVTFYRDGTYSMGARNESSSSGAGGTYASQGNSGEAGRWQVNNGRLFISEGRGPLEAVDLKVTYNSDGAPILKAEGREYVGCD